MSLLSTRSALYAWGGPGTLRLLNTKYFHPQIDQQSFLQMYNTEYLKKAQSIFHVTDMFVTYSWGFSEKTEKEDRQYIVKRLANFKKEKIVTYAYVQGFNVVHHEFRDHNIFCRSPNMQILPYSRGRSYTCPSNPQAVSIIRTRAAKACQENFDGIYIDNLMFGIPPIYVYKNNTSFFGCSCLHCQQSFQQTFGYNLPLGEKMGTQDIADYLRFRTQTLATIIRDLSHLAHAQHKLFGINLFDPWWHQPEYYMGYHFPEIDKYLDYYMVENHALGHHTIDNHHLGPHINGKKPFFVVSYRKGIGRDAAFRQKDFNRIYTESQQLGYIPCYKATEYKTKGRWHALDLSLYKPVQPEQISNPPRKKKVKHLKNTPIYARWYLPFLNYFYSRLLAYIFESRPLSKVLVDSPLYTHTIRKRRIYN